MSETGPLIVEDRFPMSVQGCAEAKKWLEDTGKIHLLQNEQSTDGWTLVVLANCLHRQATSR